MKIIIKTALVASMLLTSSIYAQANLHQHHLSHVRHEAKSLQQALDQSKHKVNLNQADETTLSQLKGVGPKKAAAIVAFRNAGGHFASINELSKVKGIGGKLVTKIIRNNPDRITVE